MIEELEQAAGRHVSRETFNRIQTYIEMLRAATQQQNLIGAQTLPDIWKRHVLDSAQLLRCQPDLGASWVDVGSGAGLPGIIIAIMTGGDVTLVEHRRLRAEFLRTVVCRLGLRAAVHSGRVEQFSGLFDTICGRAVARLDTFFKISAHLSTTKTIWVLPKGRRGESELAEARRSWQGVFHVEQSLTDPDSRIIVATGLEARH